MKSRRSGQGLSGLFRSKLFVILTSVAVFLSILPLALGMMGRGDIVRSGVSLVTYPFRELGRITGSAIQGFSDYFTEFDRLKEENERLREELAEANKKLDSAIVSEAENEWLRNFILFSLENPEYQLIDAIAVSRDSGELVTYFTVNKGSPDGVALGMPVMSTSGLIGYVCEVGLNYARVKSIVCDDTSVGALCPRSAVCGVIEGNYSFLADGACKFICSDGRADVKVGDMIVTSGQGSVYPYGLPIGRVERIEINEYTRELIAYIAPYNNFEVSDRVMIVGSSKNQ